MWGRVVFYILDIAVLYVLSKWFFDIGYSRFLSQSGKRSIIKGWYGTYQRILKVRCQGTMVKLFAGISGILSSISEYFNDTKKAILLIAFILIIISAFCEILESLRNTPKRQRIGYVLMSAVYFLIGIFFYENSSQDPLTNSNSVNMCMVYFYSSLILVPVLQYVSQWHISVYHWWIEIFLWLHLIFLLYWSYLFISFQTPDNTVFILTIVKILLSVIFFVFDMYMKSKLRSSKQSQTSFFPALLQDYNDDAELTSVKVNKTVFTMTKESGKLSKDISLNVRLPEGKDTIEAAAVINLDDSSKTCLHKKNSSEIIYEAMFFKDNK